VKIGLRCDDVKKDGEVERNRDCVGAPDDGNLALED
jgi:hypothetical protein